MQRNTAPQSERSPSTQVDKPQRPLTNQERTSIMLQLDQKLWEQGYEKITQDLLVAGVNMAFMRRKGSFAEIMPNTVNHEGKSPVTLGVAEDDDGVHIAVIVPIEAKSGEGFIGFPLMPGAPKYLVSHDRVSIRDRDDVAQSMSRIEILYIKGELKFMASGIPAQQVFDGQKFQPLPRKDLDMERDHRQARETSRQSVQEEKKQITREAMQVVATIHGVRKSCTWLGATIGVVLMISGDADAVIAKASDKIQEIVIDRADPEIAAPVSRMMERGEEIFAARKENPLAHTVTDFGGGALAGGLLGNAIGRLLGRSMRKNHNKRVKRKEQEWSEK